MSFLYSPLEVACCHVACVGGPCQYQPPAIGPELPRVVDGSDGSRWVRHEGRVFYHRRADGGYNVATWHALAKWSPWDKFPAGPWSVVA